MDAEATPVEMDRAGPTLPAPPPSRYHWSPFTSGHRLSANWARLLASGRHIDPYLVWADASGFAGFGGLRCDDKLDGGKLPVLVELKKKEAGNYALPPATASAAAACGPAPVATVQPATAAATAPVAATAAATADVAAATATPPTTGAAEGAAGAAGAADLAGQAAAASAAAAAQEPSAGVDPVFAMLDIPGAYKLSSGFLDGRHFTARVLPANVCLLLDCDSVRRVQLGVPRIPATDPVAFDKGFPTSDKLQERPRVVVGIIDDGCAFAHPAFCATDGSPRVQFLWDQNPLRVDDKSANWTHRPPLFGYGAELGPAALRTAAVDGVRLRDELYAYRDLDYAPVTLDLQLGGSSFTQHGGTTLAADAMRAASHGTSVMFLAAGSPPDGAVGVARHPVDAQRAVQLQSDDLPATAPPSEAPARADQAARWPIIFVQLPSRTTLDTSGGSLGVHVLDGVRYILDRARQLPYETTQHDGSVRGDSKDAEGSFKKNKVVINISYGAVAGCHDGTSILETALAALVPAKVPSNPSQDCHITIAAGNAHQSRTHARLTLAEGAAGGSLQWTVAPDNPLESYLEIWLPDVDVRNRELPANAAEQICVSVTPPGCGELQQLRCGHGFVLHDTAAAPSPKHQARRWTTLDAPAVVAGAFFSRAVAQGLRGTMVLLAVARTRAPLAGDGDGRPVAPHGVWKVDVDWLGHAPGPGPTEARMIDVHAWAERNDLVWGNLRAQQSTVIAEVPASEPTESTAEARELIAHSRLNRIPGVADPLQPRYSFGTLAGLKMDDSLPGVAGRIVVAGGWRLADGEVAAYSSGGPYRQYNPVFGGSDAVAPTAVRLLYKESNALPRTKPDVSAPSDVGVALRGLRVVGTRAGGVARLSGTSAAAPLVARQLANDAYAGIWKLPPLQQPSTAAGVQPDATGAAAEARPTVSPRADDLYRRGERRIR